MIRQLSTFLISVLVHITVVMSVAAMSNSFVLSSRPAAIDLSLLNTGDIPFTNAHSIEEEPARPCMKKADSQAKESVEPDTVEQKNVSSKRDIPCPIPDEYSEPPSEIPDTVPATTVRPVCDTDQDITNEDIVASSIKEAPTGIAGMDEGRKALYLANQFDYIQELIRKNATYPPLARKLGVEGKVVLSFLIKQDGGIKDVRITKSCGSSILDRNALEALSKASPFPRPPVEAEIVIPVIYRLE